MLKLNLGGSGAGPGKYSQGRPEYHRCRFRTKSTKSRLVGNIRRMKQLTDEHERAKRAPFPTDKILDLAWPFRCRYRSEKERRFLIGRVRSYAYGHRRGSFKLPSSSEVAKELVAEVSKMTKRQIRERLYLVRPSLAADSVALRSTFDFANRVLSRVVWRVQGSTSLDCARRVDTHRLDKRDWPRNPRSLWPSSPSVSELLVMTRSGKSVSCHNMWKPPKVAGNSLRVHDLKSNLKCATRVVADNVVGLRSTVSVPKQFLPWFRYRDGILFLTVRYSLPAGLVRLILGEWIKSPYNLWLQVNCRLKYYLRLHDTSGKSGEGAVDTVGELAIHPQCGTRAEAGPHSTTSTDSGVPRMRAVPEAGKAWTRGPQYTKTV